MRNDLKSEQELAEEVVNVLERADKVRELGLADALKQTESKRLALSLERSRLIAAYGPECPRVQQVEARLAAYGERRNLVHAELQRARIRPVKADQAAVALHGRVVDSAGAGIAEATVTAYAADGRTVVGKATSDELGHYSISVPAGAETAIILEVRQAEKVVHRDTEAQPFQPNTVSYVEILVPAANPVGSRVKPAVTDRVP